MASRRGAFHQFEQLLKRFEVDSPVNKQQLKRAYLKKVKLWHPDVSSSPQAKKKFLELQDDYHNLEKFFANRQFLIEWEQYKSGSRTTSSLDFEDHTQPHYQPQQRHGSPFRRADGTESAGPEGNEKYYYYHSGPFTRPESRNLDDDPFEQYRKYYEERLRKNPEPNHFTYADWRHYRGPFPFLLSPQLFLFLSLLFPLALLSSARNRRDSQKYTEADNKLWVISREIKSHLWEELKSSNLSNCPLSCPNSFVLLSIDSNRDVLSTKSSPNRREDLTIGLSSPAEPEQEVQVEPPKSTDGLPTEKPRRRKQDFWDGSEEGLYKHVEASSTGGRHLMEEVKKEARKNKTGVYAGYPDRKHRTALHYAAYSGQTDLCRLLLIFNANPLSLDGFHDTPIDAARQCGWKDVERLLVFAASGSYKLAMELSGNPDPRLKYSHIFASTIAANLGSYVPQDIGNYMERQRQFSFR